MRRLTRRRLIRDASMAAAGAAAGVIDVGALPVGATPGRQAAAGRVAVLGGGVGGLTAAHELAERGFDVTVYERKALGGKARSIPLAGTGQDGRRDLPGEHGFRIYPGFYKNVPNAMSRIPFGANPHGVKDNLVTAPEALLSRTGGREDLRLIFELSAAPPLALTPDELVRMVTAALEHAVRLPPDEAALFARRLLVYVTSSDERRLGQWDKIGWWEFIRAEGRSPEYRGVLGKVTRNLLAARPELASAHTIGLIAEAFIFVGMRRDPEAGAVVRSLNGPTNEAWIDPWATLLEQLGVRFDVGWAVESLDYRDGRIVAVSVRDPNGLVRRITADWFVCAMPVERLVPLLTPAILDADPTLANLSQLRTDWMNGIQFYLPQQAPIVRGHVSYVDSPWALTSVSQAQLWHRNLPAGYGDGTVNDILSAIISDWDTPGVVFGKPAKECTPDQITQEVWKQIKDSVDDTGEHNLPNDIPDVRFLDPAITNPGTPQVANDEPLLINSVGSWELRPTAATAIPNLFLAADYVRNDINLATMEGANEAAREAVRQLLVRAGSTAAPPSYQTLFRPPEFEPFKEADALRFAQGQPNIFDVD